MTLALLRPDKPGVYTLSMLYDPISPNGPGRIIPAISSLVVEEGQIFTVTAIDPTTYATTLIPAITKQEAPRGSVISYGNDIFHLYYDTRTTPTTLTVESRCVILGGDPASYQIIRYPDTSNAIAISQHYGVSGNYLNTTPPMQAVSGVDNTWSFSSCVTTATLTANEPLLIQVFNSSGAQIAQVTVHAAQAAVINQASGYQTRITDISIIGNQSTGQTSFFVYVQQSIDSLFLQAQLTYDDGTTTTVPIDQTQCFLYGAEDFIASYPGLVQNLLLKYYPSPGELIGGGLNPLAEYITTEITVTVIPYPTEYGGKISVIPLWNTVNSTYTLRYFYYTLNHNAAIDVTNYVTISSGTFVGTLYGQTQQFTLTVDLHSVNPIAYPASTLYTQNVVILLQPIAALVRYILRDSLTSTYAYGQDSTASRRPLLYWDTTLSQMFVPASVFSSLAGFLLSFYTNANPLFDITVETSPPQPTHFLIRDPNSSAMLVPAMLPISTYTTAFNTVGNVGANYLGKTVIVEFIQQVGSTNLILLGVPVEVYTGTYSG